MIAALPVFLTLVRTAYNAVASKYIDSDTATQYINLGLQVAQSLTDAEMKLIVIRDDLRDKKKEAAAKGETWKPEQSEIDALWERINSRDAAWDDI